MTDVVDLASDFPQPSPEAWRALALKTLKGAPLESLASSTADGLPIEPLYTAQRAVPPSPARPAFSPEENRPWDLRALVAAADPAAANARALEDLQNGAASVLLETDGAGLERALDGVMLELAPVALDAGWNGVAAAQALGAAAKASPRAKLRLHLDPLSAFARDGQSPAPLPAHIEEAARAAADLAETYPEASFFLASGRALHEAGGTEAQELGFALAAALAYARALEAAGLSAAGALPRITLGLSADAQYFVTIAKLRAARLLWAKLAGACGVNAPATIEARSSRRMLTRDDAWNNLLRLTAAGFAAGVGGADAVVLEPFTAPLGAPTAFARRQARNIQLVLMEEAGLGRVSDPAGGAWFIETLTDRLARGAWDLFRDIESRGGAAAVLASGGIAERVEAARDARRADYAEGRAHIVGVTRFPNPGAEPPAVEAPAPPSSPAPAGAAVLQPIRWSEPFEEASHGG